MNVPFPVGLNVWRHGQPVRSILCFLLIAASLPAWVCSQEIDLSATDSYGGLLAIQSDATGYFRTEQINGRWLFITPEGHGYLPLGANHVSKYVENQAEEMGFFDRVGGSRVEAYAYLIEAMRELGLNAGEAYAPIAPEMREALPWVANLRFPGSSKFAFDVFDPGFQARLRESFVHQCEDFREDPLVLGVACADLPVWDERRIQFFEGLPSSAPGAKELTRFRQAGKSDEVFLGHVADTLYQHMKAAVTEGAPNHLFFGERFRLRGAPDEVIAAVGKHVDVFCTQALILSPQRPPEWQVFQQEGYDHEHELTGGKPMMVIDWAAPFSLGTTYETDGGELRNEAQAAEDAATWLLDATARHYMIGVFKCQLIGLHGNDAWFDGKARRTYLRDNGSPWEERTRITREAHLQVLTRVYGSALKSASQTDFTELFQKRGFNLEKIAFASANEAFPVGNLADVAFEPIASFDGFPEGPSYRPADGSYFFSGNVALTRVDPEGQLQVVLKEPGGGGTHLLPDGSMLLIGKSGLRRIYPDGRITLLADGDEIGGGNDLTVGKYGEIYFSVPGKGIYRLTSEKDGKLERVSEMSANGLEVDPTGEWIYLAAGGVQRHRIYGPSQPLGDREKVCDLPKGEGGGDGCTFDLWGNFYTLHFRTGKIRVIDTKRKEMIASIEIGVVPASNLTFGGQDNADLFVTAGAPKHGNCQVLKAAIGITGFPGHPGSIDYPEIRMLEERANVHAFAAE